MIYKYTDHKEEKHGNRLSEGVMDGRSHLKLLIVMSWESKSTTKAAPSPREELKCCWRCCHSALRQFHLLNHQELKSNKESSFPTSTPEVCCFAWGNKTEKFSSFSLFAAISFCFIAELPNVGVLHCFSSAWFIKTEDRLTRLSMQPFSSLNFIYSSYHSENQKRHSNERWMHSCTHTCR